MVHEPQDEQVLPAGQVVVHRGVLPGQAGQLPHPVGLVHYVVAGDAGRAGVGPGERGQDPDGGGLACAVRPEEGAHAAGRNVQVEPVQGRDLAERLTQAGGLDHDDHLSLSYLVRRIKYDVMSGRVTAANRAGWSRGHEREPGGGRGDAAWAGDAARGGDAAWAG